MRAWQCRQRPRRRAYESSGTLSSRRISWPQDMQADGGRTIERRSGTRAATTFRKLPSASPGAKTTAASAKSTVPLSAAHVPELRDWTHRCCSLAARYLRKLRERVHGGIPGHSHGDEGEAVERRGRRLTENDRRAVKRPIDGGSRADIDDVRGVHGALEVGADELDAVPARHLVVGGDRAVAVGDEAEQVLRRVPGGEGARRSRAVAAELGVLHQHRAGRVDRRLALVANDATDIDLRATVQEDRAAHSEDLARVVPRDLAVDGLALVGAPRREVRDALVVVLVRELVRVRVARDPDRVVE